MNMQEATFRSPGATEMTGSRPGHVWSTVRRALLVVLAVSTVGVTYNTGLRLGMLSTLSTRHTFYSLPYAVSHGHFGTRGYVILRDVAELFINSHPNITNDTLARSIALHPSPDKIMLIPGDDKGDADFAVLAFRVFGMRIESLYYLWFALYLAGIVAFAVVFWQQVSRLAALCILTFAVYVAFFALPLTFELGSIHNPRAFGVVSLIPLLHLSLAMIDRQRLTGTRLLAAVLQAALIAFAIHVRTTEWWQALAMAGASVWLLIWGRGRVASLWPCAVLVAVLAGLNLYQRFAADQVYEQSHLLHRVVWHNIGVGFALNPVIAKRYSLLLDDLPMIRLVRQRLVDTNRARELDLLFRPSGHEDYLYEGLTKDFVRYEQVAREVVLSIVWNNKREALRTFVFDKPRVLMRQLAWAMGYRGYSVDQLYLSGQVSHLAADSKRTQESLYLNPFRPWVLGGMLVTLLCGGVVERRHDYAQLAVLSSWLCLMSVLPSMVAYPIITALAVVFVTLAFMMLSLTAWLVGAAGTSIYPTRVGA